jgi:short chain dehydrogenase
MRFSLESRICRSETTRQSLMQSDGQVVIVTGAASGIGRELCRLFGRRRAKIGLIDREKGRLDAFAEELRESGVSCAAAAVDISQRKRVQSAVRQVVGILGTPDILISCVLVAARSDRLRGREKLIGLLDYGITPERKPDLRMRRESSADLRHSSGRARSGCCRARAHRPSSTGTVPSDPRWPAGFRPSHRRE